MDEALEHMLLRIGYLFDMKGLQKIFKLLPKPHIIKPKVGDLIIFNSERSHSVASIKTGVPITNQLLIPAKG